MSKKRSARGPGLKKTKAAETTSQEGGISKLFRLSTALSAAAKKVLSPQGWKSFGDSMKELQAAQEEFERETNIR